MEVQQCPSCGYPAYAGHASDCQFNREERPAGPETTAASAPAEPGAAAERTNEAGHDQLKIERERIVSLLKNRPTAGERESLVKRKEEIDALLAQAAPETGAAGFRERLAELAAGLPRPKEGERFSELAARLPSDQLRERYLERFADCLKGGDPVAKVTAVQGLNLELSRIASALDQGLEEVDFDAELPENQARYQAYRNEKEFGREPTVARPVDAELDVPIVRTAPDGRKLPFILDVKNSPRRACGAGAGDRNQVLKYQKAVESGLAAGAALEINGRLDGEYVTWLMGTAIDDPGAAPDVEVVYALPLPSGKEYRFPLRAARRESGNLRFENRDRYDERDRAVIAGLERAVIDKDKALIRDILTGTNIADPSPELAAVLADPLKIKDLKVFEEYERKRLEGIWRKAENARHPTEAGPAVGVESPELGNDASARSFMEGMIRRYQEVLRSNPNTTKAKQSYALAGKPGTPAYEALVTGTTDIVTGRIAGIRQAELARREQPDAAAAAARAELGYQGPENGYALDAEHLMLDGLLEANKREGQKGRTYEEPEKRFLGLEQLRGLLADPGLDRRYRELVVHDPAAKKESAREQRLTDLTESKIAQAESKMLVENLQRAEAALADVSRRAEELAARPDQTPESAAELSRLRTRLRASEMNRTRIDGLRSQIESLRERKKTEVEAEPDVARKREIAARLDELITASRQDLAGVYTETLGGQQEWDKFAKRAVKQVDRNVIKFIYVVEADGAIRFDEEKFGGPVTGRAAHSELAGGRNVFGAGEAAFEKVGPGQWRLKEVNNGSGHYRPGGQTLTYVRNIIGQGGFDISEARRIDALLRVDLETGSRLGRGEAPVVRDLSAVE